MHHHHIVWHRVCQELAILAHAGFAAHALGWLDEMADGTSSLDVGTETYATMEAACRSLETWRKAQ